MSRVSHPDVYEQRKKYRHSLEIARDMLLVAIVKVRKTRIMYQANLSYRIMEKYLKYLLENGLIERGRDSFYIVTRKGKNFLQMYENYLARRRRIHEDAEGAQKDRLLLENMCFNNEWNSKFAASRPEILEVEEDDS